MVFPAGLISVEVFFPPAQWKKNSFPNCWDQTFDFCHKEVLFHEIKKEKPHSNNLSESQTP